MRTVVGNELASIVHNGKRFYEDLTIACLQGQIVGIVGEEEAIANLLSTLAGHLQAEAGRVLYDGYEFRQKGGEVNSPLEILSAGEIFPSIGFIDRFLSGERYTLSRADLIRKFFPQLTTAEIKKGEALAGQDKAPIKLAHYLSFAHKAFFLDKAFVGFSDEQITISLNLLRELTERFKDIIFVSGCEQEKLKTVCDYIYSTDTSEEIYTKPKELNEEELPEQASSTES